MLLFFSKKIKVAVHNETFHSDDVFAVAILSLYLNKPLEIFRTRDPKILSKMDYVLDVGREYNPKENKFDHHQEGWNEKRKNEIPYATSGLVWKEFGLKITGSKEIADKIDEKIIQSIDAEDNGVEIYQTIFDDVSPYQISDYIFSFNPTWIEKNVDPLEYFKNAVMEAERILKREIKKSTDNILGKKIIQEIYKKTKDKRILVLDGSYSCKKTISSYPEPLLIVQQATEDKIWHVNAVNINGFQFKNRLEFPLSWAGKEGNELAKITGVPDAIFCHNKRFMCAVRSKEGAIALAKLAIEEASK